MNTTPTATVPNKYRNDLTAGACYGRPDYLGQWSCLCDFPLPTDAGVPMRGRCYCAPLDGGAP